MTSVPRHARLVFLIKFLKWYISRNTGKCELGEFLFRQSHNYEEIGLHDYSFEERTN